MNNLGGCYSYGHGCVQNKTTAFEWYTKSAQLGCKNAQDNLNSAALGANGNEQSHTSKRRKTEASASSDDELL